MNLILKELVRSRETRQRFLRILKFAMRTGIFYMVFVIFSMQLLLANHEGKGQNLDSTYVTIEMRNENLKSLLKKIEKQTDLRFTFLEEQVRHYKGINLPKAEWSVRELLDAVIDKETDLAYAQVGNNYIIIKEKDEEVTAPSKEKEQKESVETISAIYAFVVTGTVIDAATQQPMAGVNIIVKGTAIGTTTDADGKFAIDANDNDVLVFSFIGFVTYEAPVSGQTVIDVMMEQDIAQLEEVVVSTGYWEATRRENPGNISRVDSKVIEQQPIINPLQALQARVPGLRIDQRSGEPGGEFFIRIRGQNSVRGTNEANNPLVVIDGIPYPIQDLSGVTGADVSPSPLNAINPNDIASIEVLKDADATAIYGSLGANGVILITTKKGLPGKTSVDVNVSHGVGEITKKVKLLNTEQYLQMRHEALANEGLNPNTSSDPDLLYWNTTRYTDWQRELIGSTSHQTKAQLSISGGNENTQLYVSGGYIRETTVYPEPLPYQRGTLHVSGSHAIKDKFDITLSLNLTRSRSILPSGNLTLAALTLPPNAPEPFDETGNLNWENNTWRDNPYAQMLRLRNESMTNLVNNFSASYKLTSSFQLKGNFGYNILTSDVSNITPISSVRPSANSTGRNVQSNSEVRTWILEPQLIFNRVILGKGSLSTLIGTTFRETISNNQLLFASGFANDATIKNLSAASILAVSGDNLSEYKYTALFSRINFNWSEKYFLNLTGRKDGSSRFGRENRFANFGAVGVSWIFTREHGLSDLPIVNFGKIRFSYGTSGNDGIGNYRYLPTYSPYPIPYQGVNPLRPNRLGNPEYQWESTRKMEFGLELGMLGDRVYTTVSHYRNRSSNQLIEIPLPDATGFSGITDNLDAIVENTGWEFEINSTNITSSQFHWTTSINASVPRNKLVDFPNLETSGYRNNYVIGQPLESTKVYQSTGVDPETGIYTFKDFDENGSISSPNDKQMLMNLAPEFEGGLQNTISYKGFQLDFFFQFRKITSRNYMLAFFAAPGYFGNQPEQVMERWQNEGDNLNIQRFTRAFGPYGAYWNFKDSDAAFVDASFIRLKNIALSYTLPRQISRKWNMEIARVYVQAQNLFGITNYDVMDPESGAKLPPIRMIATGLQLTF